MKFGVNKNALLITAGVVWIIAGVNILRIGVVTWMENPHDVFCKITEAAIIFLLFFIFVFKKLYDKHTHRIDKKQKEKNCPFSFFDVKGWVIMVLMITIGIIIRVFQLLPNRFIAVFYTGLSLALIITGCLFIIYWWKNRTHKKQ